MWLETFRIQQRDGRRAELIYFEIAAIESDAVEFVCMEFWQRASNNSGTSNKLVGPQETRWENEDFLDKLNIAFVEEKM